MKHFERKWMVLGASFSIEAIGSGFLWSIGVFYTEIMETFNAKRSVVSSLFGLTIGFFGISGIATGVTVHWLGCQRSGILASIIAMVSFVSMYFATSVIFLYVFLGIGIGGSVSLLDITALTAVKDHFEGKSRNMAISFCLFGIGVGGLGWPHVFEFFFNKYGLKGTFLILGGLLANCVPLSALLITPRNKQERVSETKDLTNGASLEECEASGGCMVPDSIETNDIFCIKVQFNGEEKTLTTNGEMTREVHGNSNTATSSCFGEDKGNIATKNESPVEHKYTKGHHGTNNTIRKDLYNLLTSVPFVIESFGTMIALGFMAGIMSIIMDHMQKLNYQESEGVLMISFMNLANSLSRFIPAILKQIPHMSILAVPSIAMVLSGLMLIAIPFVTEYALLSVMFCVALGMGSGVFLASLPLTTLKLVDPRLFDMALGMSFAISGTCAVVSGPIVGSIKDEYDSYDMAFYLVGGLLIFNSAVLAIPFFLTRGRITAIKRT